MASHREMGPQRLSTYIVGEGRASFGVLGFDGTPGICGVDAKRSERAKTVGEE
jgi:hypothetical protein